jgi:RNA polymerase primary sigma factor
MTKKHASKPAKKDDPKKKKVEAKPPAKRTAAEKDKKVVAKVAPKPGSKAAAAAAAAQAADAVALAKEKLKTRKAVTEVDDDEVEESAIEMMEGGEVDANAQKDEEAEESLTESPAVKDLLAQGKKQGFVNIDDVNEALGPGDAVSPEQIDDVMSMFGDNDVEVVDAQKNNEGQVEVKPTVAAEEDGAEEDRHRVELDRSTVQHRGDDVSFDDM